MKAMITNGGPHPADKWADVTVEAILALIKINDDSVSDQAAEARQAKRDLRPVLFDVLYGHHDGVQRQERAGLSKIKDHPAACEHCDKPLGLHPDVQAALEEITAALKATPFAEHFIKPETQQVLRSIIGQYTADVQHIERRYHIDRLAAAKGA